MNEAWPESRLGTIARVDRGISWSAENERVRAEPGSTPVVRIGNVQRGRIDMTSQLHLVGIDPGALLRKIISPTMILMVGSNGNPDRVGNAFQCPPDLAGYLYASFLIGIDPHDPDLSPYVCRWLQSDEVQAQITASTSGSTGLKNLSLEWLRDLRLRVPTPAERRRIVDLVSAVEKTIGECRRLEATAAYAGAALSREAQDEATESIDLGKLATVRGGKRLPKGTPWSPIPTQHPYIRVLDLNAGAIQRSGLVFVLDSVWPAISRYVVALDDVVVSIVGTIGAVAVVPRELDGANLTENAALIRTEPALDPRYLSAYLRSEAGQAEIARLTVGTTQRKLALFRIKAIRVPYLPIARQREIANIDEALRDVSNGAALQRQALETLRSTLLTELISGNHEIPDSYDRLLDGAA
jgi:hypothetical protein